MLEASIELDGTYDRGACPRLQMLAGSEMDNSQVNGRLTEQMQMQSLR